MKNLKDFMLNEASSLSKIGVNYNQIKGIYSKAGGKWSASIPDANASWEKFSSKKAVTDQLKSKTTWRGAIVGVSKDGSVYVLLSPSGNDAFVVKQYDTEGNGLGVWKEKSGLKALSYFKGVSDYYFANQGAMYSNGESDRYSPEVGNADFATDLAKLIEKQGEALFNDVKKKLAKQVGDKIQAGDFAEAYKQLKEVVDTHYNDPSDMTLRKLIVGRWSNGGFKGLVAEIIAGGAIGTYGYNDTVNRVFNQADKNDIRKAGAEVLRRIKERLSTIAK